MHHGRTAAYGCDAPAPHTPSFGSSRWQCLNIHVALSYRRSCDKRRQGIHGIDPLVATNVNGQALTGLWITFFRRPEGHTKWHWDRPYLTWVLPEQCAAVDWPCNCRERPQHHEPLFVFLLSVISVAWCSRPTYRNAPVTPQKAKSRHKDQE